MSKTPAEIYAAEENVASFASAVTALKGKFPFEAADMIALGELYFERFPDRAHGRNMDEVHTGYTLTRVCIIEKAVAPLSEKRRPIYRDILSGKISSAEKITEIITAIGRKDAASDYKVIAAALDNIKMSIDLIPKGMIKERYVGGISNLYNILYILKMHIS